MIRVLVVDDHSFFRRCLIELVNAQDDVETVGQCSDGIEVVAAVRELAPHVVLMDVRMAAMSGIEAVAALQRDRAGARVVMLAGEAGRTSCAAARANGASGFLLKGAHPDVLVDTIHRVAYGGSAWPENR